VRVASSLCCTGIDTYDSLGPPQAPLLHVVLQLNADAWAQVLLPKLVQQGSAEQQTPFKQATSDSVIHLSHFGTSSVLFAL
jgi:hypothetical protein